MAHAPSPTDAFRQAMGGLASGLVVVTTWAEGRPWGLTVSSCCSVSAEPPTLLVSLGRHTRSAHDIAAAGRFGIGILGESQLDVAQLGAAPGQPKWLDGHCEPAGAVSPEEVFEAPVLRDALAHLDCRVVQTVPVADHLIFLGEVERIRHGDSVSSPLVYFRRGHRQLAPQGATSPSSERGAP